MSSYNQYNLLIVLLTGDKYSLKYLARKFEVSERTIRRYIDKLYREGIPVECKRGVGGGVSLDSKFRLKQNFLSKNEIESLLHAINLLASTSPESANLLIKKISSVYALPCDDVFEIDFMRWYAEKEDKRFEIIRDSIFKRNIISLDYISGYNKITTREFEPYKLIFKYREWCLEGYCLLRQEIRVLRVSGIINLKVTNKKYQYKKRGEHDFDHYFHALETVYLHLQFTDSVVSKVYRDFNKNDIELNKDNKRTVVKTHMPNDQYLIHLILSYGEAIEIVEPIWIKKEIRNILRKMNKKY